MTPQEKDLITVMLNQSDGTALDFLPQLEGMSVQSNCSCGCPSITFAPPPESSRLVGARLSNIVFEMIGQAGERTLGLILWQAGGKLSGLEVYDFAGSDGPFQLPRFDSLTAA